MDLENLWSKTYSKRKSKRKLDWETFHQFFFFWQKALKCHVWRRNCEKNSFKKNLDLENIWSKTYSKTRFKTRSKTKLDLENFHHFFFLQKALKCHVWWRNCEKNPFKIKFGFRKSLVQEKVQDKVELGNFSPILFFFLQKALKCHVWWRNCEKNAFKIKFGLRKSLV